MVEKIIPCSVTEICGAFWGDEGKCKVATYEAQDASLVLRTTGGNNAGHTVYYIGNKLPLHLVPGGIIYEKPMAVICAGVVINPRVLKDEIDMLSQYIKITPEKLAVSDQAHLIMPYHPEIDAIQEKRRELLNMSIGTTKRGIGPAYQDQAGRFNIRMQDLFRSDESLKELLQLALSFHEKELAEANICYTVDDLFNYCMQAKEDLGRFICDVNPLIRKALLNGDKIVIEGAQADHLDMLTGDYPDCTSSQCNPSGALSAAGIGPKYVDKVIATVKAYSSRVGNGVFPTELSDADGGQIIRELGHEYGTTTQRSRRCGWLDLVAFNENRGYTDICLNHLDTIGKIGQKLGCIKICLSYTYQGKRMLTFPSDINVTGETPTPNYWVLEGGWEISRLCRTYEDLPKKAKDFINVIETRLCTPVTYIGIGPNNEDTIIRK